MNNQLDKIASATDYFVTNGLGYDLIGHYEGEEGLQRHLEAMEMRSRESENKLIGLVVNELITKYSAVRKGPVMVCESPAVIEDFQKSLEMLKVRAFQDDKVHENVPYVHHKPRRANRELPIKIKEYMKGSSVGRNIRKNFQRKY
jgi:hypothetical protein